MNNEQKQQILDIVANDCKVSSVYINHLGETCAIGALALEAGITEQDLGTYNAIAGGIAIQCPGLVPVALAIESKFGLDVHQQRLIQHANDETAYRPTAEETIEARRSNVRATVESLEVIN